MKFKTFITILALSILTVLPTIIKTKQVVFATNQSHYIIENNNEKLSADYLDFYSIPTSMLSLSNNGGAVSGCELSKAFDRNFSTCFKSSQDNNVSYTDSVTGETKPNFINVIDVEFSSAVTLDRIIYSSENGTTRGYPTNLNLYYNNGSGFQLINNYQTSETTKFVVFEFGTSYEMTSFRFEYVKVSTNHKYCATAKEIIFLQPETNNYNLYQNLFTDYANTKLNKSLNSTEKLNAFATSLESYVNFSVINNKIERARKILSGELTFNDDLEFSTNPNAKKVIERLGNLESYARNDLKLSKFGTNRQVIGVSANAGDEVSIYVSANDGDPLPKIRFSQHMGHWRSWMGGEVSLSLGKNTFIVPSFYHADYTVDVCLGGPIYIINPYTADQQSENVKIYIEGGTLYPVLSKNIDSEKYLEDLNEYCEYYQTDPTNIVNVTEIVTDHTIVTVNATKAKEIYANFDPNKSITNWNVYMDKLLNFGGIYQDKNNPLFNEKNLNIKVNLRVVQPWLGGWMFAAGEHIGVLEGSQTIIICASGIGWGVTHEIGHMLDINERTVSETTNNMWAKFNETAIENVGTRGSFDLTLATLAPDSTYNENPYFVTNEQNYLIWWYLEAWQKGYWANLENCYRGIYPKLTNFLNRYDSNKQKLNLLTPTEKQVFYSSLITGVDLSYYFERWGFSINNSTTDPVFKQSTASATFVELMNIAIRNNFINNTIKPKLWYQNAKFYYNENSAKIYDSNSSVSIKQVAKTSGGYNIFINTTSNENHFGFEIYEGNADNFKVIGFTYSNYFKDTNLYADGYTPTYKIVAIDKTFSSSKLSEAKTIQNTNEVVCRILDTEYTSLIDAVNAASSGDNIILIKSCFSECINIDKNLTITILDDEDALISITKIESGNLFNVASGVELTLKGIGNNYLILDGYNFSQSGGLVSTSGVINCEYVEFLNSISSANCGAIIFLSNSKNSVISNCKFTNNTALNGAAICVEYANVSATINNSIFTNNIVTNNGIIFNKGTLNINDCSFLNNIAGLSVVRNYDGGVLKINSSNFSSNKLTSETAYLFSIDGATEIKTSTISSNSPRVNSYNSIYFKASNASRKMILEAVEFNNNTACEFVFKIEGGNSILTLNSVTTNKQISLNIVAGSVKVKDDCNFGSGNINLTNGANFVLVNNLFENFNNCSISLQQFSIGMKVLSGENFSLTDEILSQISNVIKVAKYGPIETTVTIENENNVVYAYPTHVALILNNNGELTVYKCEYNKTTSLNIDVFKTKYITKYETDLGEIYKPTDSLILSENTTLKIYVKDKIKVNLIIGKVTKTEYYIPNEKINLPNELNGLKILKWKCNNEEIDENNLFATQDVTLIATYINVKLIIFVGLIVLTVPVIVVILKVKNKKW